ncbi:MAG TPA: hypothetical protein VFA03_06785 [Acetobacteraceae bacterium]|nr:hypothetical protein [Acetobacteraceae bacterium]
MIARPHLSGWLLTGALIAVPGAAPHSQTAPPSGSEANIWDYRAHQPTQPEVRQREQQTGLAPSAAQRNAFQQEIQDIDRKLDAETGQGGAAPGSR